MRRRRPGLPVRCHCGKRVALRDGENVQILVDDYDLPWLTCNDCLITSKLADLEQLTEQRRANGWER